MKRIIPFLILLIIICAALIGFYKTQFCFHFQELYKDTEFSSEGLKHAENYKPENDSFSLPQLENKTFFESIDDLSICRRKEVRKYLYIYLTKGRSYVINAIERSYLYMDIINNEFKEFSDLPDDILLLPLLESGFNPYAVSRTRAVGLWQFVKSTSSILGLKRNRWVDERRNVRKSTIAALTHLKNIYPMFNSWEMTLAAYNGGAGYVTRKMRKAKTDDFWALCESGLLRDETRDFVPRFAALALIYKNQKMFGIDKEITRREKENTKLVTITHPVNIHRLSKITGLPVKKIRHLNPELKSNLTPPDYSFYNIRLPVEALKNMSENPDKPIIMRYTSL
ncbi:MAG: lytic transglycosylase domain-containing protein [Spirochaetes bacterium]|nr:lytic transglycosylase domain-containing protein [Spirochaetota bacterium]